LNHCCRKYLAGSFEPQEKCLVAQIISLEKKIVAFSEFGPFAGFALATKSATRVLKVISFLHHNDNSFYIVQQVRHFLETLGVKLYALES
jgi:hypothetical protein